MDEGLAACRLIQFASVTVVFGASAFRLYAVRHGDERIFAHLDTRLRGILLIAAILALLSALLFVPLIGGRMAGSASAALDWNISSTVLLNTGFGRVWRWHLLVAALLVVACALRQVQPVYRLAVAAVLLASLGLVGHAAIEQGPLGIGHKTNDAVHLLAGGLWLGGLVPLGMLVLLARRSEHGTYLALLRDVLPRFSRTAYGAVALVAATGFVNAVFLVGSIDGLIGTPYGRLLLVKVSLFLLLLAIAVINRLILTPSIRGEARAVDRNCRAVVDGWHRADPRSRHPRGGQRARKPTTRHPRRWSFRRPAPLIRTRVCTRK